MRQTAGSPLLLAALLWLGCGSGTQAQPAPGVPAPPFAPDTQQRDPNRPTVPGATPTPAC
jgi:hypothetical protein